MTNKGSESLVERLTRAGNLESETGLNFDIVDESGNIILTAADMLEAASALSSAEGGGSSARADRAARVASQLCDTHGSTSLEGAEHPSQMPPEMRAAVDAELKGAWLGSLPPDDDDWFFDMDGKP